MTVSTDLFRSEAVEALQGGAPTDGEILQLSPRWATWSYWILVATSCAFLVYFIFGTYDEYASGPAVIRVQGRMDLTAPSSGTVATISIQPGQRVARGEPLVNLFVADEVAELERLTREFDLQLIKLLRDPTNHSARDALTALRSQREWAEARASDRTLRAPVDGVVTDLRIRIGQRVSPGELVLSLVRDNSPLSLVAFLPGESRPLLQPGMRLRVELTGFAHTYQNLTIDSVGDEVIGPAEARRFLGHDLGDAYPFTGPIVLVKARLPKRTFLFNQKVFGYYDGTPARAEARLRRKPIAAAVIPLLDRLWGGNGD